MLLPIFFFWGGGEWRLAPFLLSRSENSFVRGEEVRTSMSAHMHFFTLFFFSFHRGVLEFTSETSYLNPTAQMKERGERRLKDERRARWRDVKTIYFSFFFF